MSETTKRTCLACGKIHNLVVQDQENEMLEAKIDKCFDCFMNSKIEFSDSFITNDVWVTLAAKQGLLKFKKEKQ